jgi:hypothetical protein
MSALRLTLLGLALALTATVAARADDPPQGAAAAGAPAAAARSSSEDDDLEVDPVQPDFTVVNLPTTLRLPKHKLGFRVTHRFARPLGAGDFGDLVSDFFGFDNGAQIGLELRFGLFGGTQLGIYRTNDRTIQFFAERELLRQGKSPVGVALYATDEGIDNFKDEYSPALSLVVSRKLGTRAAVYAMPGWVGNTNALPRHVGEDDNTFILGLAGRVRVLSATSIVGEWVPRLAGHQHGADDHLSFGFEHRVGGHSFQFNFSNSLGSTLAQIARGAGSVQHTHGAVASEGGRDWFIGFNISRKFY